MCQWHTTDRATWSNISRDLAKHSGVYITCVHGNCIFCPPLASGFLLHDTWAAKMDWRQKASWKFPSTPPIRRLGLLPLHIELCGTIFTLYPRPKSSRSLPRFSLVLFTVCLSFPLFEGRASLCSSLKISRTDVLSNLRCAIWSNGNRSGQIWTLFSYIY